MQGSDDIIVNPKKLRDFALKLKIYNDYVEDRTNMMKLEFKKLSESWRDQDQRKFAEEYQNVMLGFDTHLKTTKEQVRYLNWLADSLEQHRRR